MQFTVPQFIDREDRILGPVTVRQFLICIVGAILVGVVFAAPLPTLWFVVLTIIVVLATATIAFVPVNGRPFHFFLINLVERIQKPRVRVWNKELSTSELRHYIKVKEEEQVEAPVQRPRLTTSRLSQLALVVDTGGGYRGDDVFEALQPPKPEKKPKR